METLVRFLRDPQSHFFLFGPRGTGKSTWLKQREYSIYLDLLDPIEFREFSRTPERLRQLVDALENPSVIVIDEIQKLPELLDVVHQIIEQQRGHRFVLTGSSARKLRQGATNLLGGRLLRREMHPLMANELAEHFQMDRALQYGLIPLIYGSHNPREQLAAYASVYVKEEVQAEALTRNIVAFSRFVESISFSHGSVLNLAAVARDCGIERNTAKNYLAILEDLLLIFRVPVFNKRAKRHLVTHEKLYFFDCGLFRSVRPKGPLDRPEEIEGAALEGLVASHLRAWAAYRNQEDALYYWRTKSGVEVDFVVYGPETFHALEIKRAHTIQSRDLSALRAFRSDYPEARATLLYMGTRALEIDGIRVEPCEAYLRAMHPDHALR